MLVRLRARLLLALALPAALSACKKDDDSATGVEGEGKKKKKSKTSDDDDKTKEPEKPFVPESYQGFSCGSCPCAAFCMDKPAIVEKNDEGEAKFRECGKSAKVPSISDEKSKFVGQTAYFRLEGTKNARPEHPNTCCYTYRTGPCGKGRPMREGDRLIVALESSDPSWARPPRDEAMLVAEATEVARRLPISARTLLASHLRKMGLLEHASVAAFAHVSLELMALGAPPDLVAGAHQAALDEVRHAQIMLALATGIDGRDRSPGPLITPPVRDPSPLRILRDTLREGCMGETVGAVLLDEAARHCAIPALRAIYAQVGEDEARHAELAWRTVQWLLTHGISEADRPRALELLRSANEAPTENDEACSRAAPALGVLGTHTQRRVFERVSSSIMAPIVEGLAAA